MDGWMERERESIHQLSSCGLDPWKGNNGGKEAGGCGCRREHSGAIVRSRPHLCRLASHRHREDGWSAVREPYRRRPRPRSAVPSPRLPLDLRPQLPPCRHRPPVHRCRMHTPLFLSSHILLPVLSNLLVRYRIA